MQNNFFTNEEIKELIFKYHPSLGNNEINLLLSISKYEKFKNKEIIFKRGRKDKKVFITLKGSARSYTLTDGEEHNCHLRAEGFLMGDAIAFSDNQVSLLTTEAISDIHVLIFDLGELEEIAFKNPKMMQFYLNLMKEIIVVFSHRIHTFVSMNASERYDDLMKWNPLYLKSTYDKHLASFLGITPLTFHRVKNKK